jgi:bla regulator protein blaR1
MTLLQFWNPAWTAPLFNHLWQSTGVALLAWLLTLALKTNPARIRYSVWMIASVKFLVPFALLESLGSAWVKPVAGRQMGSALYSAVDEISRPFQQSQMPVTTVASGHSQHLLTFAPAALAAVWLCGFIAVVAVWMMRWRRAVRSARAATPVYEGREVNALRSAEQNAGIGRLIPLHMSSRAIEPGIFGMLRPILLWPAGISMQLTDVQIEAIAAHEVEHVRRRDNLTSAIHMLVEAVFWFHPAVRWIGSRLVEERERACDERVVEQSARPEAYAESILKVCAFCLEPPVPCISGVSGADLKERVLRIMMHKSAMTLGFGRRALLSAIAALVFTLPIGLGVLHGQQGLPSKPTSTESGVAADLPKFEVASIKPAPSGDGIHRMMLTPDGSSMQGIPVQMLLHLAFGVEDDRILGAPSWTKSNRYDIEAKVAPEDAPRLDKLKQEDRRAMLLPLLAERFNLKYHHETRELPMYALVVAKGGPRLTISKTEPPPDPNFPARTEGQSKGGGIDTRGRMMMAPGRIESQDTTIEMLTHALAPQVGHSVVDKTGLTGRYDYTLEWTPDNAPPPMPGGNGAPARGDAGNDTAGVSLITAIQEQLGLKLESEKGKVDVIVIDHIDPPTEN